MVMKVTLNRSGRTTGGSSYLTQMVRAFNKGATSIYFVVSTGEKQQEVVDKIKFLALCLEEFKGNSLPVTVKKEV